MNNITIVGLGGIGSILANVISRFEDFKEGSKDTTITLIDGDSYEAKNKERQDFISSGRNKAETKSVELESKFRNLKFKVIPNFITENNVYNFIKDGDIVFLCVDNHKTRKIIDDATYNFNDITIISGGNELVNGSVQIYVKRGGKNLTPTLSDYHPEIEFANDKLPTELSCEERYNSEPQLLFTNLTAATCMTWAYFNLLEKRIDYSNIYFDISKMELSSKYRKPKNKKF